MRVTRVSELNTVSNTVQSGKPQPGPAIKSSRAGKTFFGQPRMLANLFSVELWERFSFYGMQGGPALLHVLRGGRRRSGHRRRPWPPDWSAPTAARVYLSTILGAWVADRLLGSERSLFYSAIMIMLGHIALALIPGRPGLAIGLILVAFGSGGLKANATSLVGSLYALEDDRRDAGFSIFYMGVNIGGAVRPAADRPGPGDAGLPLRLRRWPRWAWRSASTQYALTRKNLPEAAHHDRQPAAQRARSGSGRHRGRAVVVLIVLAVLTGAGHRRKPGHDHGLVAIVAADAYFVVILSSKQINGDGAKAGVRLHPDVHRLAPRSGRCSSSSSPW